MCNFLDNRMYSATVSSIMTDYKKMRKSTSSRLLGGYGAVIPKEEPEDWRKVREEMEEAMAEEVKKEDENK
jgi:hypothetical protein